MDVSKLVGVWFHSHEEDEGDHIVYRNDAFDFPRSRAPRASLVIEPDGTAAIGGAGPADETISEPATWEVSGNVLKVSASDGPHEWEIEALDDDRLILRREQ